jgi:membrane protein YdbS with pleckstrin-like domain
MNSRTEQFSQWFYQGVWGVLTRWFRVPREPPTLPVQQGEAIESFRPAPGFLRYLKLQFWFWLILIDVAIFIGWLAITAASPVAGVILALPALFVAVVPDVLAYVAIHLRYDTTWYVVSDRSLRIRRGIWIIHETTITFENVQNVTLRQGPFQRLFGIADLFVQTAGGGGKTEQGHDQGLGAGAHQGRIEGVANAARIRDLLLARMRRSRSAGLGDEDADVRPRPPSWSPAHLAALREIRDAARQLAAHSQ